MNTKPAPHYKWAGSLILSLVMLFSIAAGAAFAQGNGASSSMGPTQQQLDNAGQSTTSWLMYNKGYRGQRYTKLNQINAQNAQYLHPVCAYQLGHVGSFETGPVEYKGVLYVTTSHETAAIDATTCKVLWTNTYKPTGPEPISTNRGVALYHGMLFRGTDDGHLLALDMRTGKVLWNQSVVNSSKGHFISAAPIVYKGMVLVGSAGADWGANAHMYAFKASTGKQLWSFSEVKKGTWGGAKAESTGGGSNWTSFTLNPNNGLIYIPVGNPAPDFAPQYRPGKNLYTDSVIVLDASTGKLHHYYQQISNDSHDWDTASAPVLFKNGGTPFMAVANKGGHLYVYNESTQKLAYKVPTTTLQNTGKKPNKSGVYVCPGDLGGVEWNGPAYDPSANTILTNGVDWCGTYKLGEVRYVQGQLFFGGSFTLSPEAKASGWINAFDPATGNVLWRYHSSTPMVAGVTPTSGGVLFTGDLNGNFLALNAQNGNVLYKFQTGGAIAGGVITYQNNGTQYVATTSGNSSRSIWHTTGSATMYVFALH